MTPDLNPRASSTTQKLSREEFRRRFQRQFCDRHFDPFRDVLEEIGHVAWENYLNGRKAPSTRAAGEGYADPTYELSEDWIRAREKILEAEREHGGPSTRILLICASDRNENTCPGEFSKTSRLVKAAEEVFQARGHSVETLDLSLMTAEFGKTIYPCKGCVSTAMPLCHWPCSCYPHHSLGQTHDWMNEIYPMWVRAHGIMIITPVYWYQAPSCLKLLMDRLVCADGGNPDPTSTKGKSAGHAKELELQGWAYPRHLQGRSFSVVVHGDAAGAEELKNHLCSWLEDMHLTRAPGPAHIARYIDYYGHYATSHLELDKDAAIFEEVRNAAVCLSRGAQDSRSKNPLPELREPRPK